MKAKIKKLPMDKNRTKYQGKLFVVGGPGASGVSTISKMLARQFTLTLYSGGELMKKLARYQGFSEVTDFLESDYFKQNHDQIDSEIDREMMRVSQRRNVLIESKTFCFLSHKHRIECTVKIWITASLQVRLRRMLERDGVIDIENPLSESDPRYLEAKEALEDRYKIDAQRYGQRYGVDYSKPELYNDIVVDTTLFNQAQSYALILQKLKDGAYLK